MPYSEMFKRKMVQRLSGPEAVSATALSKQVDVPQATLSKWLRQTAVAAAYVFPNDPNRSFPVNAMAPRRPEDWPAEEKLKTVLEAQSLSDEQLGAFLRQKGLHEAHLERWRQQMIDGLHQGRYLGSESSFYRVLKEHQMLTHRQASKPAAPRPLHAHVATGPCQVWSWDITFLRTSVQGMFFYLYLFLDVWSRKIVAAQVFAEESMENSARLFQKACWTHAVSPDTLVLHSDNGGPMKGSTMLVTLQKLGVVPSFSRPRVSDDNPFSEALFRTLKYRPQYPPRAFENLEEAQAWVDQFVTWYNTVHLHSSIRFVSPDDRHYGREEAILANRQRVYQKAQQRCPDRWTQKTRNWNPVRLVYLNPEKKKDCSLHSIQQEAA